MTFKREEVAYYIGLAVGLRLSALQHETAPATLEHLQARVRSLETALIEVALR